MKADYVINLTFSDTAKYPVTAAVTTLHYVHLKQSTIIGAKSTEAVLRKVAKWIEGH